MSLVLLFYDDFKGWSAVQVDAVPRPSLHASEHLAFAIDPVALNPVVTLTPVDLFRHPDRIDRPSLGAHEQQFTAQNIRPEETVQLDWAPSYPERALRAWMHASSQPAFTTSAQPERTSSLADAVFPHAVFRPALRAENQRAVTDISPRAEETKQLDWSPSFPEKATRAFLPVSEQSFFAANVRPEERIQDDWWPVYPDRALKIWLNTAEHPSFTTSQQPERNAPMWSVTWADGVVRPTFGVSAQLAATNIAPFPERTSAIAAVVFPDRITKPFLPVALHPFVTGEEPQPEERIDLDWEPVFPERAIRAWLPTSDQQFYAGIQAPERTQTIAAVWWPDRIDRPAYAASEQPFVTGISPRPEERIQIDWPSVFAERVPRATLPIADYPSFATSQNPEQTIATAWQPSYPDRATRAWFLADKQPSFACYPVPIAPSFVQNVGLAWWPDRPDRVTFAAADQLATTSVSPLPITTAALTWTWLFHFEDSVSRPKMLAAEHQAFALYPSPLASQFIANVALEWHPDGVVRPAFAASEQMAAAALAPQPERKSPLACTWHPDRIEKPYLAVAAQLAVTELSPRPEERIPLDWSPNYPERARKLFLGAEEHPFFFPTPKPERTTPIASVTWPDRIIRPALLTAAHPFWTISAQPEQRLSTGTAVFPERVVRPTYSASEQAAFAGPAKLEPFTRVDWDPKCPDRALHQWLVTASHPAFTTSQRPELTVALAWEPVYPDRATKAFLGTDEHPFFFSVGLGFVIPSDAIVRLTNVPATRIVIHYAKATDARPVDVPKARIVVEHAASTTIDVENDSATRVTVMANDNEYVVGATAELRAYFRVKGVLTNPSTLTAEVKLDGTLLYMLTLGVDAALTMESTGVALALIDCTAAGQLSVYWKSTGAAKGAETSIIRVKAKP